MRVGSLIPLLILMLLVSCVEQPQNGQLRNRADDYETGCFDNVIYYFGNGNLAPKFTPKGYLYDCNGNIVVRKPPEIKFPECKPDTVILSPDNYFTQKDINTMLEQLPVSQKKETIKFLRKMIILDSLSQYVDKLVEK